MLEGFPLIKEVWVRECIRKQRPQAHGPSWDAPMSAEKPGGTIARPLLIILERPQQLGEMTEDWTQGTTNQPASPRSLER